MPASVLVVEDDPKQAEMLRRYLVDEGYEVLLAHDGREGIDTARLRRPDLIVLDLMLPRVDGFDVCRALRRESETPILMVTARSGEDDLLLGFDLGVNDFVTKPYSPREMLARIRSLLRAPSNERPNEVATVGDLVVDVARHRVLVAEHVIEVTPAEFTVLQTLAFDPGRVFTRRELLERIHGFDRYITERTVDVHVKNLRRKIERDPASASRLETVYGVGYRLRDSAS